MFKRHAASMFLCLAVGTTGCTETASNDVKKAQKAEVQAVRDVNAERVALSAEQVEAQAKLDREQAEARAKEEATHSDKLAGTERKLDEAEDNMSEARRKVENKVQTRWTRLDARTTELQTRAKVATPEVKAKLNGDLEKVESSHTVVVGAVRDLRTSSDATLARYETEADKKLDVLESALKGLDSKLK